MQCPNCSSQDTRVIDSRLVTDGRVIKRRRKCAACEFRFNTFEKSEKKELFVRKRDNTLEEFNLDKLRMGIVLAFKKRMHDIQYLDVILEDIQTKIGLKHQQEISSVEIGKYVLAVLSKKDPVAFIRFASVYRSYENVEEFITEIKALNPA